ncbi:MAG: ABC transporter ATP-binding protein [Ghiorsea sp.]
MQSLLSINHLNIQRGEKNVCADFNFALKQGEVVVILGPNGAGKSSLLLALASLLPSNGEIEVMGKSLADYSSQTLMQSVAWQGDLPPAEFGLTVRQRLVLVVEEGQRIKKVVHDMDISFLLDRPLQALSSGERQRVELAALMLRDAPIWLLDEPTTHLDLKHQIKTIKILKKHAQQGRGLVLVLHDMQQAKSIADNLIFMDGKGGVEFGSAEDLWDKSRLSVLFDAPLQQQGEMLVADYGENDEG